MITVRPGGERGRSTYDWLDSRHTFSFGDYHDPRHMGFRTLRVLNEDRVRPGAGFPTHPHRDMEIVTYVLDGALEHRDSLGTGSVILPGQVQRMSAGTGVTHSEYNHSRSEPVHFLQIWFLPERAGVPPGYEQGADVRGAAAGRLRLVAAREGTKDVVTVHQDAALYVGVLAAGIRVTHTLAPGRHAWLQVARGTLSVNGTRLAAGDGAAASDERSLEIVASEAAEVLLFDLG